MKKIFIDGGARTGESLEIIRRYMPEYLDHDFVFYEPNPNYISDLSKICKENPNYKYVEGAIWNKNSNSDFYIAIDVYGDVGSTLHINKHENLDRENPLNVRTFDIVDIVNDFDEEDYVVLKLDVEGSEYDIVKRLIESGNAHKINEYLIEWHDQFYDGKNRFELIEKIQLVSKYKDWCY